MKPDLLTFLRIPHRIKYNATLLVLFFTYGAFTTVKATTDIELLHSRLAIGNRYYSHVDVDSMKNLLQHDVFTLRADNSSLWPSGTEDPGMSNITSGLHTLMTSAKSGVVTHTYTEFSDATSYDYAERSINRQENAIYSPGAVALTSSSSPPSSQTLRILAPLASGQASSQYFPIQHGFDGPPTWDATAQMPTGGSGGSDVPGYSNRTGYIDFGPDYADLRITSTWTQYRPNSQGDQTPYALVWWDDDNDDVNDNGVVTTAINFNTAQGLANVGSLLWVQDTDHSNAPITPLRRYLVLRSADPMGWRAREYAIVGYSATDEGNVPDQLELQALRDLYEDTNGASWTNNTGWPSTPTEWDAITSLAQVSNWHGVQIEGGDVTGLLLSGNNLVGALPSGLSAMAGLRELQLHNNTLSGRLPSLSNLTELKKLRLEGGNNQLSGPLPEGLDNLAKLTSFQVSGNNFTGTIPASFNALSLLSYLGLEDNAFTGLTDFTAHPNATNLQLHVANNYIPQSDIDANTTGTFHTFVYSPQKSIPVNQGSVLDQVEITALRDLYESTDGASWTNDTGWPSTSVAWDAITSTDQIINWHGVTIEGGDVVELSLSHNTMEGELPVGIFSLSGLRKLDVGVNNLSGDLSQVDLSDLTELFHLSLQFNRFIGDVPVSLTTLPKLTVLSISNNLFRSFPDFTGHPRSSSLQINIFNNYIPPSDIALNMPGGSHPYLSFNYSTQYIWDRVDDSAEIAFLRTLYENTGGLNWTNNTGWPSIPLEWDGITALDQVSDWYGIKTEGGDVIELSLPNNNMEGEMPLSLSSMTGLRKLAVGANKLEGSFPSLEHLVELVLVSIGNNRFEGPLPSELGNLTKLSQFYLPSNRFTGDIPASLTTLPKLNVLIASNNLFRSFPDFTGHPRSSIFQIHILNNYIPASDITLNMPGGSHPYQTFNYAPQYIWDRVDDSTEIAFLRALYENTGGANWANSTGWPSTSMAWDGITTLDQVKDWYGIKVEGGDVIELSLSHNNLEGVVPSSMSSMTGLRKLILEVNKLQGNFPSLEHLVELIFVSIGNNRFEGPLPSELGNLTKLSQFYLPSNRFTGAVPESLTTLPKLNVLIASNNLFNSFPDFRNHPLASALQLCLINNYISASDIALNMPGGSHPYHTFHYIPQKILNGAVIDELEIQALRDLYEGTSGANWADNTGWPATAAAWDAITSVDQLISWYGITVENGDLSEIALDDNSVTGSIPLSLEALSLKKLFLSGNQISGEIPGFLFQLPTLVQLSLTDNQFTGALPNTLNLPWIEYIDIGSNRLSGEVPSSISTLGRLKRLTLNSNNFEGDFPPFDLAGQVYDMNIADNQFTSIPYFERVDELRVQGNLLTFESLETQLAGGTPPRVFSYAPQNNPVPVINIGLGSNVPVVNDRSGGSNTTYQWQQWNGTAWAAISGAVQEDLTLTGVDQTFIGNKYRCEMNNTLLTGMTIYSSEFEVTQIFDGIPENYQVKPMHNGNITSMQWRTTAPVDTEASDFEGIYLFDYDDKYQLTQALWGEATLTGGVNINSNRYRVTGLEYDPNGNINALKRYDEKGHFKHNFKYHYTSNTNQLDRVEQRVSGTDYANYHYNKIGQLNEELSEDGKDKYVEYDVTGKVVAVYAEGTVDSVTKEATFVENSKKVSYTYDDRGFRLTSKNHDTGITTWYIRDASGNVMSIFEEKEATAGNLVQKEVPVYGSGKIGTYYADQDGSMAYEMTDHLGNVRAVVSRRNVTFEATMEDSGLADFTNPRVEEMQYFQNLETTELTNAGPFLNHTAGGDIVAYLTGDGNRIIGPATTLKVKEGMKINTKVYAKYEKQSSYASPLGIPFLADLLGSTYVGQNGREVVSELSDLFEGALTGFANTGAENTRPLAFLNIIYFDEQFTMLDAQKVQITSESGFATGQESTVKFDSIKKDITISSSGYIYAYVSNHTPGSKVYFDDLSVTLTEDIVTQATDYYAGGSVARRANTPNSYFESPTDTVKRNFGQYYRWGFQGQFAEE
ncbi:hypothetical protein FNH22_10720, partial [Fulvivirga sp. M361]